MRSLKICLLGGTGFVGRHIALELSAQGHELLIPTRHRERHRSLLVLPALRLVEADIHDPAVLRARFTGMDVVINLVGILNEGRRKRQKFQYVHTQLAGKVAEAMNAVGAPRLLHMSALNADPNSHSRYLRSKGLAENLVHEHAGQGAFEVTSFRPSVIFGRGDSFTTRFAGLLKTIPVAFPLACPDSRLQPIHIRDVARCFVNAIANRHTHDRRYDLCGPRAYSLQEIVEHIARATKLKRRIIRLAKWQSYLQACVLEWAPGKPFTRENYRMMQVDSVCECPPADELKVSPRPMEEVLSGYL